MEVLLCSTVSQLSRHTSVDAIFSNVALRIPTFVVMYNDMIPNRKVTRKFGCNGHPIMQAPVSP